MQVAGVTEVAEALGISRQRLARLRARGDFPDPVADLAQGPVWDLDAVRLWSDSGLRRKSAGRPSGKVSARTIGDRFVLEELLGKGGFAEVWRAADKKSPANLAAVKFLHDLDPDAVRRFQREIRLLDGQDHPHVISIVDHGETANEGIWYAMPLAQASLLDMVDELAGKHSEILDVMRQICGGLAHVHQKGILHRDLKPANVLRTQNGLWAISDFGLAVDLERETTTLTATAEGMGTPFYMSPEQMRDAKSVDATTDIFSLGKLLHQLVTGKAPVGDIPAGRLRPVIQRATETRPGRRYQSVDEFLAAVETAIDAPKGRWESPEDTAERLLARIRLPQPATDDLVELLEWAQRLDETSEADMAALVEVLPWMQEPAIEWLWKRNGEGFRQVFEHLALYLLRTSFQFGYCDVIANFVQRVATITNDPAILRTAVAALADLGYRHNRWHVRDVLANTLQAVRHDEMAVAAAEGLQAARRDAVEWSVTDFAVRSLHPTLRAAVGEHLD